MNLLTALVMVLVFGDPSGLIYKMVVSVCVWIVVLVFGDSSGRIYWNGNFIARSVVLRSSQGDKSYNSVFYNCGSALTKNGGRLTGRSPDWKRRNVDKEEPWLKTEEGWQGGALTENRGRFEWLFFKLSRRVLFQTISKTSFPKSCGIHMCCNCRKYVLPHSRMARCVLKLSQLSLFGMVSNVFGLNCFKYLFFRLSQRALFQTVSKNSFPNIVWNPYVL